MSMEVVLIRWVLLTRLCRHYRRLIIKQSLPLPSNHFVYLSNTELTPDGSPPHSLLMSDDSSSRGFGLAFNYLAAAEGMSQLLKYVTCLNAHALTIDDRLNSAAFEVTDAYKYISSRSVDVICAFYCYLHGFGLHPRPPSICSKMHHFILHQHVHYLVV